MRLWLKALLTIVSGLVLGVVLTWVTVRSMPGGVSDGPWRTSLTIGSSEANPWQRAAIALHGLFALNRSETIYYTASHDSGGQMLDGNCIYRLKGHEPDARWWSITAYGPDDYLMANKQNRYSVSKTGITRNADGTFTATLSKAAGPGNWIPIPERHFSLTMRLYNPAPGVVADPANAMVPQIVRVVCP
jgi:hypothetical protein